MFVTFISVCRLILRNYFSRFFLLLKNSYIASYKEIDKVDVNVLTGSVLITYRPQVLRANRELVRVENYIMTHVERRR